MLLNKFKKKIQKIVSVKGMNKNQIELVGINFGRTKIKGVFFYKSKYFAYLL